MKAPAVPPKAPEPAAVAARQLEALFVRRMLSESHGTGGGMLDGGFAGDTFKQMMDEALADKMTAGNGIGMQKLFAKQLSNKTEPAAPQHAAFSLAQGVDPSTLDAEHAGAPRMILPVAGRASSGYGMRNDPIQHAEINHPGFDLAAPTGTPVAAAAAGKVTHAGPAGTYGNLITVRHASGYETRYAHLSAVTVHEGDEVAAGQQIGNVGTTGYSTGPHLHFEVRHDGKPMDPAPLLPLNGSGSRSNR